MGSCLSVCASKNNPAFTADDEAGIPPTPVVAESLSELAGNTSPRPSKKDSASSFRAALPGPSTATTSKAKEEAPSASAEVDTFLACRAEFSTSMQATLEHLDDRSGEAPMLNRGHREMAALLLTTDMVCKRHGIELDPLKANTDITAILNAAAGIAAPDLMACENLQFANATEALHLLCVEMDATPHLNDIAPEHRFRLCIDPIKLAELQKIAPAHAKLADNPLLGFLFDNEPGYLHGMAKAWQSAMSSVDEPVTSEGLKTLNALATGYRAAQAKPYATTDSRSFGMLFGRTLSESGETEVRRCVMDNAHLFRDLDAHILQWLNESKSSRNLEIQCLGSPKSNFDSVVRHHLVAFQKAIEPVEGQDPLRPEKLAYASIDLAQKLERLHPFDDGNCRTFTIMLNKLLVQNGLKMSIIDDPNKLDGFSRAEVLQLVSEGQERVNGWRIDAGDAKGCNVASLEPGSQAVLALEQWMNPQTLALTSGDGDIDDDEFCIDFAKV